MSSFLDFLMDLGKQVAVGGARPGEQPPPSPAPPPKASFRLVIYVGSFQRRGPQSSVQVARGVADSWPLVMKSLRRHGPALWLSAGLKAAEL